MPQTPQDEFQARAEATQRRAVTKYGEIALLPGGHPEYDVLDYAINELVGFPRYVEMIHHRLVALGEMTPSRQILLAGIAQQVEVWGCQIIALRQALQLDGVHLGTEEHAPEPPTA